MANKKTPLTKRKIKTAGPRLGHLRLECYISADLRERVCSEPDRGRVVEQALREYYGRKGGQTNP